MKIKSQEKWDKIGLDFLKEIETNPEKYCRAVVAVYRK